MLCNKQPDASKVAGHFIGQELPNSTFNTRAIRSFGASTFAAYLRFDINCLLIDFWSACMQSFF